jgi:hypothetical protein
VRHCGGTQFGQLRGFPTGHTHWTWNTPVIPEQALATPDIWCDNIMFSSEILAPCGLLTPFRPTLDTRSPAFRLAESHHVADMTAIFTVCLCTANPGHSATIKGRNNRASFSTCKIE